MKRSTIFNDNYKFIGTICGHSGSTAERYAKHFRYSFESVDNAETTVSVMTTAVTTATTTAVTSVSNKLSLGKVNDPQIDNDGRVTWSEAENAVNYRVAKVVGGKIFYGSFTSNTYYCIKGIPNENYKIYIVSYSADGKKTSGKTLNVKVDKPVGKVTDSKVSSDGTVSWSAAKNAVKYKVVKIVNGVSYGGAVVTETSYKFRSTPVSDYKVYVAAYGENGAKTYGKKISVKVDKPLGFVNDVKVDKNGKVTWTAARNAVKYKVYKVVNGKRYYGVTEKTNCTFKNIPDTDYSVYIVSFDSNGEYRVGTVKKVTVE